MRLALGLLVGSATSHETTAACGRLLGRTSVDEGLGLEVTARAVFALWWTSFKPAGARRGVLWWASVKQGLGLKVTARAVVALWWTSFKPTAARGVLWWTSVEPNQRLDVETLQTTIVAALWWTSFKTASSGRSGLWWSSSNEGLCFQPSALAGGCFGWTSFQTTATLGGGGVNRLGDRLRWPSGQQRTFIEPAAAELRHRLAHGQAHPDDHAPHDSDT